MGKTIVYGEIQIAEVRTSQRNAANVVVKTRQNIDTTYTGENNNFALGSLLGLNKPKPYHNTRKNTQIIPGATITQVQDALKTIDMSKARIILKEHTSAQWADQKPNEHTGLYYTTELDLSGVQVDAATKTEANVEVAEKPVMELKPE
jgi:hypothetical protein